VPLKGNDGIKKKSQNLTACQTKERNREGKGLLAVGGENRGCGKGGPQNSAKRKKKGEGKKIMVRHDVGGGRGSTATGHCLIRN